MCIRSGSQRWGMPAVTAGSALSSCSRTDPTHGREPQPGEKLGNRRTRALSNTDRPDIGLIPIDICDRQRR